MSHRVITKYPRVKSLKVRNVKTDLNAFIEIVNEPNHKPNKLRVDQVRAFYNNLMQEWLDDHDILMYLTHNEGKSVVAERFTITMRVKSLTK